MTGLLSETEALKLHAKLAEVNFFMPFGPFGLISGSFQIKLQTEFSPGRSYLNLNNREAAVCRTLALLMVPLLFHALSTKAFNGKI